jgi:hypothetical protein
VGGGGSRRVGIDRDPDLLDDLVDAVVEVGHAVRVRPEVPPEPRLALDGDPDVLPDRKLREDVGYLERPADTPRNAGFRVEVGDWLAA